MDSLPAKHDGLGARGVRLVDGFDDRTRLASGDVHEQAGGPLHRPALQIRSDRAFEAMRSIGVHPAAPRLQRDGARVEPCAFEEDVRGRVVDSTRESSHHPRERDRSRFVRDHQRVFVDIDDRAVQERESFTVTSVPDPDSGVEPCTVECMHRLSQLQHDVVGDVDDGGQRPHAAAPQALGHPPGGSGRRIDASDDAADVARTTLRRVERDGQDIVDPGCDRRRALVRTHRDAARDRDLARDSDDAQTVAAVRSEAHLDDDVVEVEPLDQVRPERRVGLQLQDAVRVLPQTQLALRAQHALRDLAPDPAPADLRTVGQPCAHPRIGRSQAGTHVGGAAYHAVRLFSAVVHLAQRQAVGAGMGLHADDLGDRHLLERPGDGGDRFHLQTGRGEPFDQLAGVDRRVDPLPDPAFVELHSPCAPLIAPSPVCPAATRTASGT